MTPTDHLLHRRGSVWGHAFVEGQPPKPAIIVSSDSRNASAYGWLHVVRVTSRSKRPLATIVELADTDPVRGRAMCDEVEPIHRDDLEPFPGGGAMLGSATMDRIDAALRLVFNLD